MKKKVYVFLILIYAGMSINMFHTCISSDKISVETADYYDEFDKIVDQMTQRQDLIIHKPEQSAVPVVVRKVGIAVLLKLIETKTYMMGSWCWLKQWFYHKVRSYDSQK